MRALPAYSGVEAAACRLMHSQPEPTMSSPTSPSTTPGNRQPSIDKAIQETSRTLAPADPIVDPGKPVGPNEGPTLTDGNESGASHRLGKASA